MDTAPIPVVFEFGGHIITWVQPQVALFSSSADAAV
jgi:hypothetical protein